MTWERKKSISNGGWGILKFPFSIPKGKFEQQEALQNKGMINAF
jgi:hypothetical protein